jgi:hypothetical protein
VIEEERTRKKLVAFAAGSTDWDSLDPLLQEVTAYHLTGDLPKGKGLDAEHPDFVRWSLIYKGIAAKADADAVRRAAGQR